MVLLIRQMLTTFIVVNSGHFREWEVEYRALTIGSDWGGGGHKGRDREKSV